MYIKSTIVFNKDYPWEVVQAIFRALSHQDLLNCRLVCRGWRDFVQDYGLLRGTEMLINTEWIEYDKAEDLLESNLFMSVGKLYISGDNDFQHCYCNSGRYNVMSKCQCDTVNGILVSIAEATDCNLPSLKISGVNTNPEALGKAVCQIPDVEIDEVIFRSSEDLEQFLSQIISCDSMVLQSLTFNYGLFRSTKKDKVLNGIDPRLLGLLATKVYHFKMHVDVRLAEAVLLFIGECSDNKLQFLELDVWNKWATFYGDETKIIDKYQSVQKRKQFVKVFKEEIKIVESKLRRLTIRFDLRLPTY